MIELQNVSKYYTSNGVTSKGLININLKLNKGEIVAITGESGSGKSTLLNVITKVDSFDDGEIYYKGNETSYFSIDDMDQFRKDKIGFIFQNYNIIDAYTVLDNVMLPLIINGYKKKDAKEEAIKIIERVGLKDRMKNRGSHLSGGEKQRCVIARALASKCEILACDEPTGNLDTQTGEEIIKLIKEVASDKLVLIVTHNFEQVKDIATRKIKIEDGEIVEDLYLDNSNVIEDKNEELNLDYKPIPRKTDFEISKNNLLATPKKTFLMCLVLFFTCFFALSLYQRIYAAFNDTTEGDVFIYCPKDRIIVSNLNHKEFSKDTLDSISDDYYTNEYYYNLTKYFYVKDENASNTELVYSYYNGYSCVYDPEVENYELVSGTDKFDDENGVLAIISTNEYYADYADEILNQTLCYDDNTNLELKVYGVAKSDSVKSKVVLTKNERLHQIYKLLGMVEVSSESNGENYNIEFDFKGNTTIYRADNTAPFKLYYSNNLMLDLSNTPTTTSTDYYQNSIIIGKDIKDILDTEVVYEATMIGNKSKMKKKAKQKDLYIIDVSTFTTQSKTMRIIMHLTAYIAMVGSSLVLVIVYFIAYAILSIIFKSNKEAYNTFRTLGVTRGDMRKIVRNETMIAVVFTTILTFIVCFILGQCVEKIAIDYNFKDWSVVGVLLYFVVMFVMGLFIARRFNTKLFGFTVREGLKKVK